MDLIQFQARSRDTAAVVLPKPERARHRVLVAPPSSSRINGVGMWGHELSACVSARTCEDVFSWGIQALCGWGIEEPSRWL